MKKLFGILILSSVLLMSCNVMGAKQWSKEIVSGASGLDRHIEVRNSFTDRLVFEYDGVSYISDTSTPGDVTIIVEVNGKTKKVDFIGQSVYVTAIEK